MVVVQDFPNLFSILGITHTLARFFFQLLDGGNSGYLYMDGLALPVPWMLLTTLASRLKFAFVTIFWKKNLWIQNNVKIRNKVGVMRPRLAISAIFCASWLLISEAFYLPGLAPVTYCDKDEPGKCVVRKYIFFTYIKCFNSSIISFYSRPSNYLWTGLIQKNLSSRTNMNSKLT